MNINFINKFQEDFFYETKRNQCASGGYGNGKTTICCYKTIILALTYPKYRVAIFRRKGKDLKHTTKTTFLQCLPENCIDKHLDHEGYLRLINGSEFLFMHLEHYDENVIRGLEINTVFIDQAEEIQEDIYNHIDGRVGRWAHAEATPDMASRLPVNPATGKPVTPSYMILACNPGPTNHWIYTRYHPDSEYFNEEQQDAEGSTFCWSDTHVMHEAASKENPALSKEYLSTLKRRGKIFYERYSLGTWGVFEGSIHKVHPDSVLDYVPDSFIKQITTEGNLYRVMDHGSSAPTACLWFCTWKNWIFCYREYYSAGKLISEHRKAIHELSEGEQYIANWADPSIFKKMAEKYGGRWSLADEYCDPNVDAPQLYWLPADNNEFRCRNSIDELLNIDENLQNPFTKEYGAPKLYFLKSCSNVIAETKAQVRSRNGLSFTDDRDSSVVDHAYDCLRYFSSMRPKYHEKVTPKDLQGTFLKESGLIPSIQGENSNYGNVVTSYGF